MKQNYFLILLITAFSFNKIDAQSCPEISFVVPLPTEEVIFVFDSPGPTCASRPVAIVIDGSAYVIGNCDTYSSRYVLSSGSGVIDPDNYTVTYGSSSCQYNNGTLLGADDDSFINKALKLYPNPVVNTNKLTVSLTFNASAHISIFTLTGKKVIEDKFVQEKSKKIDISTLANGIYIIQMKIENISIAKKFVVSN